MGTLELGKLLVELLAVRSVQFFGVQIEGAVRQRKKSSGAVDNMSVGACIVFLLQCLPRHRLAGRVAASDAGTIFHVFNFNTVVFALRDQCSENDIVVDCLACDCKKVLQLKSRYAQQGRIP